MSSEVFKSTEEHHKPVCVKIIKEEFYESTVGRQLIDNEISILQELAHPNILKFLNRQNDKSRIVLVTEYCEGGDLGQLIKNKGCVDESRSYEIMSELVEGCLYLHNMDIIHRDLKPENIFFTMNRAKIADFGFAVRRVNKHILAINVGSPLYMAP